MAVTIYYENDVDPKIIQGKKVAIMVTALRAMPMPSPPWTWRRRARFGLREWFQELDWAPKRSV